MSHSKLDPEPLWYEDVKDAKQLEDEWEGPIVEFIRTDEMPTENATGYLLGEIKAINYHGGENGISDFLDDPTYWEYHQRQFPHTFRLDDLVPPAENTTIGRLQLCWFKIRTGLFKWATSVLKDSLTKYRTSMKPQDYFVQRVKNESILPKGK
jgi:hypothetical protein